VAPNGDVWFTELVRHSLGRLRDGHVTEFSLPRDGARPFALTVDRAGNVWYADLDGRIGRISARAARATCRAPVARVDVCWPG
jgi:virginiamycin B lyase